MPLNMVSTNAVNVEAKAIEVRIHVRPQGCDHNGNDHEDEKR
jgi:hypothetical protein